MPTPKPLDPLFTLGDALLQLAPHNVLAKGGISISPVMARQPTLYEEMNRPVQPPAARSAPVPTPVPKQFTLLDACDQFLQLAPHNVLATLFRGGQMRQQPPAVPAALSSSLSNLPGGITLKSFLKSQYPLVPDYKGVDWDPTSMVAALRDKGDYISIGCPSDREFITLYIMRTDGKEETQGYAWWGVTFDPIGGVPTPQPGAGSGQARRLNRGEILLIKEDTGAYEKGGNVGKSTYQKVVSGFGGTLEHWRSCTFVSLAPPIAPTDNELSANKKAIEIATLKNYKFKKLTDLDPKIEEAGKKIGAMNNLYNEASSAMSQLPSSPQPPAPPLAAGGQVSNPAARAQNSFAALQTAITEATASLSAARNAEAGIENASDKGVVDDNYTQAYTELGKVDKNYRDAISLRNDVMEYQSQAEDAVTQAEAKRLQTAQAAQEAERARQIAESEKLEAESAANEARMKAEADAERARRETQQIASREALQQRMADEKAAAAARAAAEQAKQEEDIRKFREKQQQEQAARQAAEQKRIDERRQKLESVSEEAARLRQEAARRKLKRK
jgi:hypothetical protein